MTRQAAKAAENEHLMQELMCWDAGFSGADHYGCQALQHRHVGGTLYCRRNEHNKLA